MRRPIRLRYRARCADCGCSLPAGALARYYGPGRVYGVECHDPDEGVGSTSGAAQDATTGSTGSYEGGTTSASSQRGSVPFLDYVRSFARE